MEWVAKRRLRMAQDRRATARAEGPRRTQETKKAVQDAIATAPTSARKKIKKAFESHDRARAAQVLTLRREVQLYRTLSTAGITAATFAHESTGNPIKVIETAAKSIDWRVRQAAPDRYEELFRDPIGSIQRSVAALNVLGAATLSLVDHAKRRVGRVDLHPVLADVGRALQPFLDGRGITLDYSPSPGEPYLRATEAAIESIVTNLINNCVWAFERTTTKDKRIYLTTELVADTFTMTVADNGPGIEGISLHDLWLPGNTTRTNGTGLGLAIVHDTVKDLGGTVSAKAHGRHGGAEFEISLPVLGY